MRFSACAQSGLAAVLLCLVPLAGLAEPFVPTADDQVLERLPTAGSARSRELGAQQAALAADPANLRLALSLATSYLELGRSEADPRYEGYAQAALAAWWQLDEPPLPVLILRATLRQRRHDFSAALADLEQVLRRAPLHPQALLTKATILGVQGKPKLALRVCTQLVGVVDPLVDTACVAGAKGLGGRTREAYRSLEQTLDASRGVDPAIALWTRTILAELALQLGEMAEAERHFRAALAGNGRDPYVLGAYADFLLDQQRAGEVVTLLADEVRIDPLLLRLALAEQQLGHPDRDRHVALLEARFAAARQRGDSVHLREAARFALELQNRPDEALALALSDFAVQREPADVRVVLEAALAANRPDAAAPVLAWLARTGLEDVRIAALVHELEGRAA